jgi:serine protease Do
MSKKVVAVVGGVVIGAAAAFARAGAFSIFGDLSRQAPGAAAVTLTQAAQSAIQSVPPAGIPPTGDHGAALIPSFAPLVKRLSPTVVMVSVTQRIKSTGFGPMGGGEEGGPEESPPQGGPGAPGEPNTPPGQNPFGGGNGDPFEQFRHFFGGPPREFKQHGLGSGVIVSADGYILTNNHVVGDAEEIHVALMDKREFTAKVIGKDPKTDLALIKIDTKDQLPVAELGDSDSTEVGDWVLAIGNPFGFSLTVTSGIISAKGRALGGQYDDFIQTDASINPGNSGGPLFNTRGEVVGINTAIYSRTGTSAGIGFAIPIDMVKRVMDQLKATGRVVRGKLGVEIQEVTADLAQSFGLAKTEGALVAGIEKGTPAEKAGIQQGDVIVGFNGRPVRNEHELPSMVAETGIGKTVSVDLIRNGKRMSIPVTIAELKDTETASAKPEEAGGDWGMSVGAITPEVSKQFGLQTTEGVVVRGVRPDTPAADAGLQQGDVITKIGEDKISSMDDFLAKAKQAKKDKKATRLLVQRGDASVFLVIKPASNG